MVFNEGPLDVAVTPGHILSHVLLTSEENLLSGFEKANR